MMDAQYADFGLRLKNLLKDRDVSQLALSRATGLSQQSISGWTRGQHVPRGKRLMKLAEFFDVDPRELCPEAFDNNIVQLARNAVSFTPISGQKDWYILTCRMPVDKIMLDEFLEANARFEDRRNEPGFKEVSG